MRNRPRRQKIVSGRHIFAVLIAVFAIIGGYAGYRLIMTEVDYTAAQEEYARLRHYAPGGNASSSNPIDPAESEDSTVSDSINEANEQAPDLTNINPDYVGWIRINGTEIDYPVVQGTDNTKYLTTTFTGENNPSGTIFMDSACTNGFDFFTILHGHNMRDGSMFAGLHRFTDNRFRADFSEIIVYSPTRGILTYKIFAVKLTNIYDEVFNLPTQGIAERGRYFADFGFSEEDLRDNLDIMVLATCTLGERNERLLVFSARVTN